jgi:hypothetical protein
LAMTSCAVARELRSGADPFSVADRPARARLRDAVRSSGRLPGVGDATDRCRQAAGAAGASCLGVADGLS